MSPDSSWRDERREAFAAHAAALDRRRAAETEQARKLLLGFVRAMVQRGIQPGPLRARVPESGTSYRTNISGWYLRRNKSLGADLEGGYCILDVPASLRSRLFGVRIEPTDPPLTVGVGARDGESIALEELLRLRLEAGEDW
ncbi:hypothetical protein G1H11_10230 [Phytoactinopolyspora alkaliphila]|uniref:Uncharacterized protein n=1 Tax=Phytoactinopolyspora alkaliphila TaxID=1783498 RepID=A0A6N9YLD4_9ACTN|nr:hypothetical protein [Phytoactinopolyspora alkaliphila]NED95689.1 hypothetical protein [Phytoactinopolyspora alkaliphila]